MKYRSYFYNCSKEYIDTISPSLVGDINDVIAALPKRGTQSEINSDLFWLLGEKDWNYDTLQQSIGDSSPSDLGISISKESLINKNKRHYCETTTTIDAGWHADFAKDYSGKLVQVEAQFGKTELMFKDFCGFKMAHYERRLALGIEIVMSHPGLYFAHRKSSVSGMAYFDIAAKTLMAIGLDCPIWLIGIEE